MTIRTTSQGFEITDFKLNHVFKMHYIGYSRTEAKKRFRTMQKEQIENLNLK
jgi:hypothetical protein